MTDLTVLSCMVWFFFRFHLERVHPQAAHRIFRRSPWILWTPHAYSTSVTHHFGGVLTCHVEEEGSNAGIGLGCYILAIPSAILRRRVNHWTGGLHEHYHRHHAHHDARGLSGTPPLYALHTRIIFWVAAVVGKFVYLLTYILRLQLYAEMCTIL